MLNSVSEKYPQGIGNSSGVLGHYLMDHFGGPGAYGFIPALKSAGVKNEGGKASGFYVTRFRNLEERHPNFLRGYGFEGSSGDWPSSRLCQRPARVSVRNSRMRFEDIILKTAAKEFDNIILSDNLLRRQAIAKRFQANGDSPER